MFEEEFDEFRSYICEHCKNKGARLYKGWMFYCQPCIDEREDD